MFKVLFSAGCLLVAPVVQSKCLFCDVTVIGLENMGVNMRLTSPQEHSEAVLGGRDSLFEKDTVILNTSKGNAGVYGPSKLVNIEVNSSKFAVVRKPSL